VFIEEKKHLLIKKGVDKLAEAVLTRQVTTLKNMDVSSLTAQNLIQ
jgi:hypothetical protein